MTEARRQARQAAEAVDELARALQPKDGHTAPELAEAVAELAAMGRALPMALRRLSAGLEARSDRVRLDGNGRARYPTGGAAVGVARLALAEATEAAEGVGRALDEAHQVAATMGERFDDKPAAPG